MEKQKQKIKKYSMLQLDVDLHQALRRYCKEHGFQQKGFVQALIRQALKDRR